METKDYFGFLVNEIHTAVVATVDDEGLPVTAAIDMMDHDENSLYFFPINETSWEHMKMIWYPFLTVGIIFSFRTGNRGYFGSFVVGSVMAMLMNLGAFSICQSFSGKSVLN